MPVRFTDSITITSGGGPNPTDSFSLKLNIADTVPASSDALSVAFTFPETIPAQSETARLGLTFGDPVDVVSDTLLRLGIGIADTVPVQSDALSLGITFPETVPAQSETVRLGLTFEDTVASVTDTLLRLGIGISDTIPIATDLATFLINLSLSDTIGAQTETLTFAFTLPDTVAVQTEARTSLGSAWLSGSAGSGVTNPANANGPNDGTNAVISTQALGSTTETLTSNVGDGLPTNLVLPATAIYRGWFAYTETLGTSSGQLLLRSTGGLFTDKVMLAITANTNHSGGTFTYDLIANGVNTVALLRSCTVLHSTTDAAAGVTPAVMNVDAGAIEITAFL